MCTEDKTYRSAPADPVAEHYFAVKVLSSALGIAFGVAVISGGMALKDYSQHRLWKVSIGYVLNTRDVCRFHFEKPKRRQVTVDHDLYCDDKSGMEQFPSDLWRMIPVTEISVRFINEADEVVFAKLKVPARAAGHFVVGDTVEIKYSNIAETHVELAQSVGHSYQRQSTIFAMSTLVFATLSYFLIKLFVRRNRL